MSHPSYCELHQELAGISTSWTAGRKPRRASISRVAELAEKLNEAGNADLAALAAELIAAVEGRGSWGREARRRVGELSDSILAFRPEPNGTHPLNEAAVVTYEQASRNGPAPVVVAAFPEPGRAVPSLLETDPDLLIDFATLTGAARAKTLDRATVAYNQVTSRCVECHKYVRGIRTAKASK